MTDGYERIRAHCEWLGLIGMPMDRVGRLEAQMVRAWASMQRERRASELLATVGPDAAAERLGVCRQTVYALAKKSRKSQEHATA